jgi:predicted nucleic acid-binding protein
MTTFVDSSAWYAAADSSDVNNARAKAILTGTASRLTSDHVLVETWRLVHHRLGRTAATQFWKGLRSGIAEVEFIGPPDLEVAWAIGETYPDQDFSIVDRTSFAVMDRLGVNRVATFDSDFAIYRSGKQRNQAFIIEA